MTINCFTFSSLVGFTQGIALAIGVPTMRNDGSTHRPHLRVGTEFLQTDSVMPPLVQQDRLMSARVRAIQAQKTFNVLSRTEGSDTLLVYIDLNNTPSGVRRRVNSSTVNAWTDFVTDGYVVMQHNASGQVLVEFTKDEQAMFIFDRDGAVYRIVRRKGTMLVDPLSKLEMAKERIILLRKQVNSVDLSIGDSGLKKLHGIVGGAIRLLQIAARDSATREVFVDFLADFADGRLTTAMRKEVYGLLHAYYDPRAYMFAEGYDNVVSLQNRTAPGTSFAERRKKMAARSARDAEVRADMRGSSNGAGVKKNVKGGK